MNDPEEQIRKAKEQQLRAIKRIKEEWKGIKELYLKPLLNLYLSQPEVKVEEIKVSPHDPRHCDDADDCLVERVGRIWTGIYQGVSSGLTRDMRRAGEAYVHIKKEGDELKAGITKNQEDIPDYSINLTSLVPILSERLGELPPEHLEPFSRAYTEFLFEHKGIIAKCTRIEDKCNENYLLMRWSRSPCTKQSLQNR